MPWNGVNFWITEILNRFGNFITLDGHVFTIFVIVLAAAEAAVALAIVINLFKNIGTVDVDKAQEMKG